ncbi:MAG: helix-hairpin-helix domain-containing protein [Acholeplasmatales bacterium]|jgi:uncharacterized protein|nr:helix-hairpin-helix domain-containing protein [Acholeplasmatales bacterium]
MNENIIKEIVARLGIPRKYVETVLQFLQEGNTIPFIARYRKEFTGNMDEVVINEISNVYEYELNLLDRKEAVIKAIDKKGMLTEELERKIRACTKLVEVEDLYLPYKEKKKSKATEAIARGLEPFAKWILSFPSTSVDEEASKYVTGEIEDKTLQVLNTKEAIDGAKYIVAENISDNAEYRKDLRYMLYTKGELKTAPKKDVAKADEKGVYRLYYEFKSFINRLKSYQVLAINRAEKEKAISVNLALENELYVKYLVEKVINSKHSTTTSLVEEAIEDSLKRLILPSIETDIRSELTEVAGKEAIALFGENLYKLLLQPPMKGKVVLGLDPGFVSGCKLCVIDEQGTFKEKSKIYEKKGHNVVIGNTNNLEALRDAQNEVLRLIRKHKVELIAIGNGTASRESEAFIADIIKTNRLNVKYVIVSEAGASVYSAGDVARDEFPDFSVEERSAASIARRLQDPLSELIKIDPKSIGVGQYQYDVNQKELGKELDFIVSKSVNAVGVNVNTASKSLLMHISGLNKAIAENIVKYREENTKFSSRTELNKVPKLGPKAFEQAIGFLRILEGKEPLDMTSIHPESYEIARKILVKYNITPNMLGKSELKDIVSTIDKEALAKELESNLYVVSDILDAFVAPLRDPRDEFSAPVLRNDILTLDDLSVGLELEGTVRNVVQFGAFIDIGLHDDGLVHISKMSRKNIASPKEVVAVGDIVKVWILGIDREREKVQLSLLPLEELNDTEPRRDNDSKPSYNKAENRERRPFIPKKPTLTFDDLAIGGEYKGTVRNIQEYGIFINIGLEKDVLLRINRSSDKKPTDYSTGENVTIYVINIDYEKKQVEVSLKKPVLNSWF